jgi:hypothetical protein
MMNQLDTPAGVFPLEVWRYEKAIGHRERGKTP